MSEPSLRRAEWRTRTSAEIVTEARFFELKRNHGWYVLGVLGYAGGWHKSGLHNSEREAFVLLAREALRREIASCLATHGARLIVSTGATRVGVLELTYEVCTELGIATMSVAPDRALNYELGPLNWLITLGREFGDESELFVRSADEFLLLGGGKQSHREILAAHAQHKPIKLIQGFGGTADALSAVELPGARFV